MLPAAASLIVRDSISESPSDALSRKLSFSAGKDGLGGLEIVRSLTGDAGRLDKGVVSSDGTSRMVLTGPSFAAFGRKIYDRLGRESWYASRWPLIRDADRVNDSNSEAGMSLRTPCRDVERESWRAIVSSLGASIAEELRLDLVVVPADTTCATEHGGQSKVDPLRLSHLRFTNVGILSRVAFSSTESSSSVTVRVDIFVCNETTNC